ncbi:uncharacterized protein LOC107463947 isoform X2 [Arachis duranensis]|uniref:Uncharacterized protein n=2 Tax=Arachis TaxID=3817 RepID=A0A445BPU3_ARAHY|nr:uncharacterized protein LOC107463947 isoform X2 [Arachis duranensis]XP_025617784.1 uncharacterized protein LOC112709964 isoform X2 [Arachis hypogaea]RYR40666.1 hypothetical protein Ahy_A09g046416 [Arachis hypogaea]
MMKARNPLTDLSNNHNRTAPPPTTTMKMKMKKNNKKIESENSNGGESLKDEQEDNALDHLLLVQSNLSSLLHQVDELVVQAFKVKNLSNEGRKEIKCFSDFLSDMHSSLKPWVTRFQNVLSSPSVELKSKPPQALKGNSVSSDDSDESNVSESLEEPTMDSLISPSPLVSWHANCTIQRGRQMFMLTPLPISKKLSSKFREPSKSEFNKLASTNDVGTSTFLAVSRNMNDLLDSVVVKSTPAKPAPSLANEEANNQEPKRDSSILVMMTPRFRMSPPKSCVLLEPISEIHHLGDIKSRKSTPFPLGIHYSDSEDSESPSSGNDALQGLALKSPEVKETQKIPKSGIGKKIIEASPCWLTSPPKSCVLLEPLDEKSMDMENADNESSIQISDLVLSHQISKLKDEVGHGLSRIENTPMWREPQSTFRTGKHPGENTLKKELWTKFEAASSYGFQPKLPAVEKDAPKGFLDLLEEASCDELK